MNCPHCGAQLSKNVDVCPVCGPGVPTSPDGETQAAATSAQLETQSPVEGDLKDQIADVRQTSRKKRKFVPVIILALVLALLLSMDIAAGGWVYQHVVQPAIQLVTGQPAEDDAHTAGAMEPAAAPAQPKAVQAHEAEAHPVAASLNPAEDAQAQALAQAQATFAPQLDVVRMIATNSIFSAIDGAGGTGDGSGANGLDGIDPGEDKSLANFLAVARGECAYMAGIGSWNFTSGRIVYAYVDLGGDGKLDLVVAHESEDEEWSSEARDFVKVTRYNPLLAYAAKPDGTLTSVLQGLGSGNSAWTITGNGCFAVSGISGGLYEVHVYTVRDGEVSHVVSYRHNYWTDTYWRDYTYDPADQSTWGDVANTRETITEAQYEELQAEYGNANRINETLDWQPLMEEEPAEANAQAEPAIETTAEASIDAEVPVVADPVSVVPETEATVETTPEAMPESASGDANTELALA